MTKPATTTSTTWPASVLDHWRETPERREARQMPDDLREAFEERAAILEYDAGFSRDEAEAMALASLII